MHDIREPWKFYVNNQFYLKHFSLAWELYFDLRPEQNAIQGDAPEGSDTFQWQLCEKIAWAEIGWWNGTS